MSGAGDAPLVLGIAAAHHNGAACLMRGSEILVAIQEERITRLKRQGVEAARPSAAVAYCLDAVGIGIGDVDLVAICTASARSGPIHDVARNPQLHLPLRAGRLHFVPHHRGHALSAQYWAQFADGDVIVADGLGSPWEDLCDAEQRSCCAGGGPGTSEFLSIYRSQDGALIPHAKQAVASADWLDPPDGGSARFASLGGMYGAVAGRVFGDSLEAGKVMGLAPYAEPGPASTRFARFETSGVRFTDAPVDEIIDCPPRDPADPRSAAAAADVQVALEELLLALARRTRDETGARRLALAGGIALNAIANERLLRESGYDELVIVPAAEDSGTAIGAAVSGLLHLGCLPRCTVAPSEALGRPARTWEIEAAISCFSGFRHHRPDALEQEVAARLAAGEIGGWFQGGAEFGPRALGHRSIIADPRSPDTKPRLDREIKRREAFRPYAPAVLRAEAAAWFDMGPADDSPFMLRIVPVRASRRALIPAVVHVDGTARVQTVTPADGRFHALIAAFAAQTGVPLLLNTSFNAPGEPIVERPEEALLHLLAGGLDFCVIEDRLFERAA